MSLNPINEKESLEKMGMEKDEEGRIRVKNIGERLEVFNVIMEKNVFRMFKDTMNQYYKKCNKLNKEGKYDLILPIEHLLIDIGSKITKIITLGVISCGFDGTDEMRTKIDNTFAINFLHGVLCEMIVADIDVDMVLGRSKEQMKDCHDAKQQLKIARNEQYAETRKK